ncbi:MAG: hypothetical protein CHACPFDD_00051 [Phycisphaerae bacterium]|nr:hypothetical protein [Phycisphaerae bacterium]
MIARRSVILVLLQTLAAAASAQQLEWVVQHDGGAGGFDRARALAVSVAGDVALVGDVDDGAGGFNIGVVRYSAAGVKAWSKIFAGQAGGDDRPAAVAFDALGNLLVAGSSAGTGTNFDGVLLKYTANGSLAWERRLDGADHGLDALVALAVGPTGDACVAGHTWAATTGYDYLIARISASGDVLWRRTYNGSGGNHDYATALALDALGNVIVTGYSWGTGFDFLTQKYLPDGTLLWSVRRDAHAGDDRPTALALDLFGNAWAAGRCTGVSGNLNLYVVKYGALGSYVWNYEFDGGQGDDAAVDLGLTLSGEAYVAGRSAGAASGDDCITLMLSGSGALRWLDRYNYPANGDDQAVALHVDLFQNAYVAATSWSHTSFFDFVTMRYAPDGTRKWLMRYDTAAGVDQLAVGIGLDSFQNVYFAGYSDPGTTSFDFTALKYNQSAPTILVQPHETWGCLGGVASMSIVADGTPPLSYRWRWNGIDLYDNPAVFGSGTATVTFNPVNQFRAGTYDVRVWNAFGETVTDTADFHVTTACDVNCDGSVNGFDVGPLLDLILGLDSPCTDCAGDANGDGDVNGFDVETFVQALAGGPC